MGLIILGFFIFYKTLKDICTHSTPQHDKRIQESEEKAIKYKQTQQTIEYKQTKLMLETNAENESFLVQGQEEKVRKSEEEKAQLMLKMNAENDLAFSYSHF